jgi:hypothetical protein
MFNQISKLLTKSDIIDCSFLHKPITIDNNNDNISPRTEEIEKEHLYYKEPNICLTEVQYS